MWTSGWVKTIDRVDSRVSAMSAFSMPIIDERYSNSGLLTIYKLQGAI